MRTREGFGRASGHGGFTLVESMVSLIVFGAVLSMALSFLKVQNRGFQQGLDYMSTIQTLRHTMGTMERDIQTAGTHLAPGQPEMVYADRNVIAFNADYAAQTPDDPLAVFFDPGLADRVALSLTATRKTHIPNSSFAYPAITYPDGSKLAGPAETIIFFFQPDDSTGREDDWVLYRQVNDETPKVLARHLLQVDHQPFFKYLKRSEVGVDSISENLLPLAHEVAIHESPADTGVVSLIDSIRAVRITLRATNGEEGDRERLPEISRIVRMPNMGFGRLEICGRPPVLGTTLNATLTTVATGKHTVTLTWDKAADESGGENDIVRYVIWRRQPGISGWGEPYLSIPAGSDSYVYQDADLKLGKTYQYALATQDCTPTLSPTTASGSITVPGR